MLDGCDSQHVTLGTGKLWLLQRHYLRAIDTQSNHSKNLGSARESTLEFKLFNEANLGSFFTKALCADVY